ncbi:MAG TPA: AbrB/MazE/SpoVT family DNA-binding domain-containing protein [Acidobacteriaceae bacterium]|nr:AbrB/MazE/SpoVT family DNA-binding domain-containing protein [Acidobacteriaceae bacterium]
MQTTVTIDKSGRIVVPKDLRDDLHLTPGTVLRLERSGERLTLTPAAREARLSIENGTPLIYPAESSGTAVLSRDTVADILNRSRHERELRALTPEPEPVESCEPARSEVAG